MGIEVGLLVAVPAVVATMFVEHAVGRRQGLVVYRWPSLVSDLSCGMASLVGKTVVGVSAVGCYAWIEARAGLFEMSAASPLVWIAGFFAMDLLLYWRHRSCHRVGLWWALHAVHHQSPDLNLATANRVPWLQDLQVMPFVFVGALLGFPTPVFAFHLVLATIWALMTHTRVIGRLGWFERVFITPSHHRVHHGFNGPYLDRNFGAVLAVWDKLFGTFEPEAEEPVYGTPHSTDTMSALSSNGRPFAELFARAGRAPTWLGAVETLFRPPGWDPVTRREEAPDFTHCERAAEAPRTTSGTPWIQLAVLTVVGLVALVPLWSDVGPGGRLGIVLGAFGTLAAMNAWSAQRTPVDPNPPSPRAVSSRSETTSQSTWTTGATTS